MLKTSLFCLFLVCFSSALLVSNLLFLCCQYTIYKIYNRYFSSLQAYLWDQWHAIIEPYSTLMPYMVGIGNHEQDHTVGGEKDPSGAKGEGFHPSWGNYGGDSGGECGVPMFNRYSYIF